ncbi:MAG: efflux RND transporter periplasmic adaptor subunit [Puniceicoccaceae bacterium]
MKLKIFISLVVVIGIVLGLVGVKALQIKTMIDAGASMGPMPTAVEVRSTQTDIWEQGLDSIGTIMPIKGTTIRSEADGVVREILFEPGTEVTEGTKLVVLDQEVQLALLDSALAALRLTEKDLERTRELHARQNVSDDVLDRDQAEYEIAKATVENLQAGIDKRTIRAPFTGKLGVRNLSPGDYVSTGEAIVSLQASEEVYVELAIPQNELGYLTTGMEVRLETDAWVGEVFTGELTAINPEIDQTTRSVRVQATFDNPEGKLLPGLYVNVSIIRPEKREVVLAPKSSVMHANYGDSIFVVKSNPEGEGEVVEQRIVRLGESKGDFIEIIKGLEGTEEIVSSGAFKLRDGALIIRSSMGTVEPELAPQPEDG